MAKQIKRRRGTTAQHAAFVGAEGEVTVDTTLNTVRVHDGVTAGGFPLATQPDIQRTLQKSALRALYLAYTL